MSVPIWVLDTNVLVSGLLNPSGHPGRLIDAVLSGHLLLAIDDRIFAEYSEVLKRSKFKWEKSDVRDLFAFLGQQHWVNAYPIKIANLPDTSDLPFAEVALSLSDPILITGNQKHFPISKLKGLKVLSPQQAWTRLTEAQE